MLLDIYKATRWINSDLYGYLYRYRSGIVSNKKVSRADSSLSTCLWSSCSPWNVPPSSIWLRLRFRLGRNFFFIIMDCSTVFFSQKCVIYAKMKAIVMNSFVFRLCLIKTFFGLKEGPSLNKQYCCYILYILLSNSNWVVNLRLAMLKIMFVTF